MWVYFQRINYQVNHKKKANNDWLGYIERRRRKLKKKYKSVLIYILVQWQAWLRHTRYEPPTVQELVKEQQRRTRLQQKVRQLEVEADEERVLK